MTTAPLIGLPGRRKRAHQIDGFADSLGGLDIDIYPADYARAVVVAGGLPVHLPLDVEPAAFIDHLDGLILPGGVDVDPARYGEENTASDVDRQRDAIEFALLDEALRTDLPVLGICRGLQVINVHAGGTLHQDVPEHARYDVDPAARIHSADIVPGTALHDLYGDSVDINSLHHQTIDVLGHGLVVAGTDADGTIEAIQTKDSDIIAVQWHPEMLNEVEPVFAWLVEKATQARERRNRS